MRTFWVRQRVTRGLLSAGRTEEDNELVDAVVERVAAEVDHNEIRYL